LGPLYSFVTLARGSYTIYVYIRTKKSFNFG
jgi:hypothetical protein